MGTTSRSVPPGHSGASQYTETLPTAGGEQPTAEIHHGGSGGGGSSTGGGSTGGSSGGGSSTTGTAPAATPAEALGTQNAKRLEKLGPEGKAAAGLAAATGAPARHRVGREIPVVHHVGTSPVKQVVGELTGTSDSGGMGLLLPLLIVMTVLIAAAFVVSRRRPIGSRD